MSTCKVLVCGVAGSLLSGCVFFGCYEPAERSAEEHLGRVTNPATLPEIVHAIDVHASSTVVIGHDHRITAAEFESAINGGVSALGVELTVDGIVWDGLGGRSPVPLYGADVRFAAAFSQLEDLINNSAGRYRLAFGVQDIRAAKASGTLALIGQSEGIGQLEDSPNHLDLTRIESYRNRGWRKAQLYWPPQAGDANPLWAGGALNSDGIAVARRMNAAGVLIDVTHLGLVGSGALDSLLSMSSSPLLDSHEWAHDVVTTGKYVGSDLVKIAESGGGYGVVGVQFIKLGAGPQDIDQLANEISYLRDIVGIDHVALGADYQPPDNLIMGYLVPQLDSLRDLTAALVARGFTDQGIRQILGENLLNLYDRAWDPTHGYSAGPAHFYSCTDGNGLSSAECVAASSHGGQGDLNHRPVSCLSSAAPGPIALQLSYINGAWKYWGIDGLAYPCVDGSLLAVSWGDGAANGQLNTCVNTRPAPWLPLPSCLAAAQNGGNGTSSARALNCLHPTASGVVGLQLKPYGSGWGFYNIQGSVVGCQTDSPLIVTWGSGANALAEIQLCDDNLTNTTCARAAANGGSGLFVGGERAISCYNSAPSKDAHGTVALQVFYADGRWQYYGVSGNAKPCVQGSVLVVKNY